MPEEKDGKVLVFELKETIDVLIAHARKNKIQVPPFEFARMDMEMGKVKVYLTLAKLPSGSTGDA